MPAADAINDTIYITVLPRRADGDKLTFTALLTPYLSTQQAYRQISAQWPTIATALAKGKWTLVLSPASRQPPVKIPVTPTYRSSFQEKLWQGVVHSGIKMTPRKKNDEYKSAWILTHDANELNMRHGNYLLYKMRKQYVAHHASRFIAPNTTPQVVADLKTQVRQTIQEQADQWAALQIYIPPVLPAPTPGLNPPSMSRLLEERLAAKDFGDPQNKNFNIAASTQPQMLYDRIQHAIALLESGGQMLSALAIYAVYMHCIQSAQPSVTDQSGTANTIRQQLQTPTTKIQTGAASVVSIEGTPGSASLLSDIQQYIEFHLFAHPEKIPCEADGDPDFHQVLGLMHQYPALLRPLGLAYDFEAVTASGYTQIRGEVLASLEAPSEQERIQLDGQTTLLLTPRFTQCSAAPDFSAKVRDALPGAMKLYNGGFVVLDPNNFAVVTENVDGTSQKLIQQAHSHGDAEMATKAPASFQYRELVPAGADIYRMSGPESSPIAPSTRSIGLSLYQTNRDDVLRASVRNSPTGDADNPFHSDDLTLGFRLDVKTDSNLVPQWTSLHERESLYKIDAHGLEWEWKPDPTILSEKAADEGFMTLAASQSVVPSTSADSQNQMQVQVHQALVTWNGWSLSVPNPQKQSQKTNPPEGTCALSKDKILIKPLYSLPGKGKLPKQRFGETYSLRLRQVDLAGNSVPVSNPVPDDKAFLSALFTRSEPVRAPQVLLEKPIDRRRRPGEHIDLLVVRDEDENASRMLVPPRETQNLACLHGLITNPRPASAFDFAQLDEKTGAFPKVSAVGMPGTQEGIDSAENNDAIFLPGRRVPALPYYPDPLARMVRVEAFQLRSDFTTYQTLGAPLYLNFLDGEAPWTDVTPIRILLERTEGPLELSHGLAALSPTNPALLPGITALTVKVPKGKTVLLQVTSCALLAKGFAPGSTPKKAPPNRLMMLDLSAVPVQPSGTRGPLISQILPQMTVFFNSNNLHKASAPNGNHQSTLTPDHPDVNRRHPQLVLASFSPPESATQLEQQAKSLINHVLDAMENEDSLDGTAHAVTPPHMMTLVHATKRPLLSPSFAAKFNVTRALNVAPAYLSATINADWDSTAKVVVNATWTDCIDDNQSPHLRTQTTQEIAFEMLNTGGEEQNSRLLNATHNFRDTRARCVRYSLTAASRFREYFPENLPATDFVIAGEQYCQQILSSAPPPAVSIVYVIPAFGWAYDDKKKATQRTQVLRVYFNRPFRVSGDDECIGVVLYPNGPLANPATPDLCTRWGGDPLDPEAGVDLPNMTVKDFFGQDTKLGPQPGITLLEGGSADVLPFPVHFAEDRGLWFCDIGIQQSAVSSAFVRLALVRWQPYALHPQSGSNDPECRISQVAIADFIQIRSDRAVSVQRQNPHTFQITLSGIFPGSGAKLQNEVRYTVEQRWHSLGRDMGWRPTAESKKFDKQCSGDCAWTTSVPVKYSANTHQYRLLIEEFENSSDTAYSFRRCVYVHYVEL